MVPSRVVPGGGLYEAVEPMKQEKKRLVQIVTSSVVAHLLEQRIRQVRAAGLPYEVIDLDQLKKSWRRPPKTAGLVP